MQKNNIKSLFAVLAVWVIATALTHETTAIKIKDVETTTITTDPSVVMKMATPINFVSRSHRRIYHSK